MPFSAQRVCGHEYYEATELGGEMQFCAICDSNGAVGRCAIDHRLICGYHSEMRGGRRICDECIRKRNAKDAAAEDRTARENANWQAAADAQVMRTYLDLVQATCTALSEVKDPADRLLVIMLIAQTDSRVRRRAGAELDQILVSAGKSLPGFLLPAASDDTSGWALKRTVLVRHWSDTGRLSHRASANLHLVSYERKTFRTKPSRVTHGHIRGWRIEYGIAASYDKFGGWRNSMTPDRYVLADGTVATTAPSSRDLHEQFERSPVDLPDLLALIDVEPGARPDLPASLVNRVMEVTNIQLPLSSSR
jgi:hypothetical protein